MLHKESSSLVWGYVTWWLHLTVLPEAPAWTVTFLVWWDGPVHTGMDVQTYMKPNRYINKETKHNNVHVTQQHKSYMSSTCSWVLCWWIKSAKAAGTSRSSGLSLRICLFEKSAVWETSSAQKCREGKTTLMRVKGLAYMSEVASAHSAWWRSWERKAYCCCQLSP